ncbi:flagellar brake protein [Acetonema longum]|uniref:Type IV pilus assembly PilZ n=1 Tax=Acetonema longum DSM 6540 TaxID=1009370 RepID=F7NER0_9FIRM|nr:PilZ domain-containing protein [Acetonema longum]EGO65471.1 type IV pilus assembly PilZ [Acetonema longum DSM 6540]
MELDQQLKINQGLEIYLDPDMTGDKYLSQIAAAMPEFIILTLPVRGREPILLQPESRIYCRVVMDDVPYVFSSWVLANDETRRLTHIAAPESFIKHQMRQFVRVETCLPVAVEEPESKQDFPGYIIQNISGGGTGLLGHQALALNETYYLTFDLPDAGQMRILARVLRSSGDETNRVKIGLEFVGLSETNRNKIMKYIFKIQAERRRKT